MALKQVPPLKQVTAISQVVPPASQMVAARNVQRGGGRVALVIGNSGYSGRQALVNPANDAGLISGTLASLGFTVVGGPSEAEADSGIDADRGRLWALFSKFHDLLQPGDTALVYYAGHAMQIAEENYLVPVGADLLQSSDPIDQLVPLRRLVERTGSKVGAKGTVVVFLDACRDNPLSWQQMQDISGKLVEHGNVLPQAGATRSAVPRDGLTTFKLPRADQSARKFIALATAPGEVAYDGEPDASGYSPFALALSRHLCTRGLDLDTAYHRVSKDVRDEVWEKLGCVQEPWRESNLDGDFYMLPPSMAAIVWLGLAGLAVGVVVSMLLFNDRGRLLAPGADPWVWALGVPFGLIAAWGTMQWGSRRWRDAAIAALGPVLGFVLALALLLLAPQHKAGSGVGALQPEQALMSDVFFYGSLVACLLFLAGTYVTKRTNRVVGHAARLGAIDRFIHWSLPVLMLAGLLILEYLLTHTSTRMNPALSALGLHALGAGIIYAASTVVACKPQRSVFDGFGAFTGAVAVGILMAVCFAGFTWFTGGGETGTAGKLTMVSFGMLWHGVLGAQLGYCFAHYVAEHER